MGGKSAPIIEHMCEDVIQMDLRGERLDLLAVCRIRGISWDLVAWEAQRLGGVAHLISGRHKGGR